MNKLLHLLFLLSLQIEAQEYFLSNSLGMELTPVDVPENYDWSHDEWFLVKDEKGNVVLSTLYNRGEEKILYTREYNSAGSLIFYGESINGYPSVETEYKDDGMVRQFREYDHSGFINKKSDYEYDSRGKLNRVITSDESGEILSTVEYSIRGDGSIRSVFEKDRDKGAHSEIWNAYDGSLFLEQRSGTLERDLVYYNRDNLISRVERYDSDKLSSEEIYNYSGENILQSIVKINHLLSEKTELSMNRAGLITKEILFINNISEYIIVYKYDDRGNLKAKEKNGSSFREKWFYFYEDNKETAEEYYKQGMLVRKKIIKDSENNNYIIELYNKGTAFMNLVYENNVKIREEFLEDGLVVQFRDLGDL